MALWKDLIIHQGAGRLPLTSVSPRAGPLLSTWRGTRTSPRWVPNLALPRLQNLSQNKPLCQLPHPRHCYRSRIRDTLISSSHFCPYNCPSNLYSTQQPMVLLRDKQNITSRLKTPKMLPTALRSKSKLLTMFKVPQQPNQSPVCFKSSPSDCFMHSGLTVLSCMTQLLTLFNLFYHPLIILIFHVLKMFTKILSLFSRK